MRHGLLRPPMYGQPGGLQGEVTFPRCSPRPLRHPGRREVAHGRERRVPTQNVGFDDFYGFLSVSDMYTEWRDPYFFPEIVYSEERTKWVENLAFNKCFVHATRGGETEDVEEVTIPSSPRSTTSGPPTRSTSSGAWPSRRVTSASRVPLPLHPRRPLRQLPPRALPRLLAGQAPLQGHHHRARRHRGRLVPSSRRPGRRRTPSSSCPRTTGRDGDMARCRLLAVPQRQGLDVGGGNGCRASWRGGYGRRRPGHRRALLPDGPLQHAAAPRRAEGPSLRPLHRRVDQTSFLLDEAGESNRKFVYYWLTNVFSALRVGSGSSWWRRRPTTTATASTWAASPASPRSTPTAGCTTSTRPEGEPQLHDPKARLHRLVHRRAAGPLMSFGKYPPRQPIAAMS